MDHSLTIDIDVDIVSPNRNIKHWQERSWRFAKARAATQCTLQDIAPPQWPKYFVTLIRCAARTLDGDNLQAAFKPIRDQVAQWLGIRNDDDERLDWQYAQRPSREPNDRPGKRRTKWKCWARVHIDPMPRDLAADESAARMRAPRADPQTVEPGNAKVYVQKPGAIPDYAGGKPLQVVELSPRPNGVSSRLRVRLMRNTRDTGVGKGVLYAHVCIAWTERGHQWRSQGTSIRLEELRDCIAVLEALADAAGVPVAEAPGGVIFDPDAMGAGTDTPSDDTNELACREKCDTPGPPEESEDTLRRRPRDRSPHRPRTPFVDETPPPEAVDLFPSIPVWKP